jgi:ribosome-associated translation inhibitor RaiA
MQVKVHTDAHIEGREAFARWVETELADKLSRFRDHVTRVEVHFADDNADKSGDQDKRCLLEARLARHEPGAVSHHAPKVADALIGSIDKLRRALDSTFGRLRDQAGRESIRGNGHLPEDVGGDTTR